MSTDADANTTNDKNESSTQTAVFPPNGKFTAIEIHQHTKGWSPCVCPADEWVCDCGIEDTGEYFFNDKVNGWRNRAIARRLAIEHNDPAAIAEWIDSGWPVSESPVSESPETLDEFKSD